ncbi:MAG: hypothetical protein WC476_05155 [Phycisphaerae bacterium]
MNRTRSSLRHLRFEISYSMYETSSSILDMQRLIFEIGHLKSAGQLALLHT